MVSTVILDGEKPSRVYMLTTYSEAMYLKLSQHSCVRHFKQPYKSRTSCQAGNIFEKGRIINQQHHQATATMLSGLYSSSAFGKINDDSWLILEEAILERLPLGTTQIQPLDYVDEPGQSIYRIYELDEDEVAPDVVNVQAYDKHVRYSEKHVRHSEKVTYVVGSAGRLTLIDVADEPLAAREHHNIRFTRPHVKFTLPNVFYTCEKNGQYAIFADIPGRPFDPADVSLWDTRALLLQLTNAIADLEKIRNTSSRAFSTRYLHRRPSENAGSLCCRSEVRATSRLYAISSDRVTSTSRLVPFSTLIFQQKTSPSMRRTIFVDSDTGTRVLLRLGLTYLAGLLGI